MKPIWYARLLMIAALTALVLAWLLIPGVHAFVRDSLDAFLAVDQQGIERFIRAYGSQAAIVSFLLMIFQAIAAPLPAFLITFANASLFGAFWGGILSWCSAMFLYCAHYGPRRGRKAHRKSGAQRRRRFFCTLR